MDFATLIEQEGELKGLESLQGYNVEMGIGPVDADGHKMHISHKRGIPISHRSDSAPF